MGENENLEHQRTGKDAKKQQTGKEDKRVQSI
jgi:hypothetical protein